MKVEKKHIEAMDRAYEVLTIAKEGQNSEICSLIDEFIAILVQAQNGRPMWDMTVTDYTQAILALDSLYETFYVRACRLVENAAPLDSVIWNMILGMHI